MDHLAQANYTNFYEQMKTLQSTYSIVLFFIIYPTLFSSSSNSKQSESSRVLLFTSPMCRIKAIACFFFEFCSNQVKDSLTKL